MSTAKLAGHTLIPLALFFPLFQQPPFSPQGEEPDDEASVDRFLKEADATLLRSPGEVSQGAATDVPSVASSTLPSPLRQRVLSPDIPLHQQRTPRRASLVARESISLSVQALFTPSRIHSDRAFRSDTEADDRGSLAGASMTDLDIRHIETGDDVNTEVEAPAGFLSRGYCGPRSGKRSFSASS